MTVSGDTAHGETYDHVSPPAADLRTDHADHEGHRDDEHETKLNGGPANKDPITGQPYSHPVGTGLGTATGGAAAGAAGGLIAGPVGAAVGAVVGGVIGAAVGHSAGEAVNDTDEAAAARAEAERHSDS